MAAVAILHADAWLLAVDKPPGGLVDDEELGILVEDGDPGRHGQIILRAGTTLTGPKRSSDRAIARAGPTATTARRSSGR